MFVHLFLDSIAFEELIAPGQGKIKSLWAYYRPRKLTVFIRYEMMTSVHVFI